MELNQQAPTFINTFRVVRALSMFTTHVLLDPHFHNLRWQHVWQLRLIRLGSTLDLSLCGIIIVCWCHAVNNKYEFFQKNIEKALSSDKLTQDL